MSFTLPVRIDTNNAPEAEKEILDYVRAHTDSRVCFDASGLTYISSAGLRILMKVRKLVDYAPEINHVSRDVYDIFETTGFTELFEIKKAYRRLSVDGLEVIGRGFSGTVYRINDECIVKVYHEKDSIPKIENEKAMAKKAFLAGIPTAISYDIVQVGEHYGSVFELVRAKTFHEIIQQDETRLPHVMEVYAGLLKLVHGTVMAPGAFPSCRERYLYFLETVRKHLGDAQYEGIHALLLAMPKETTVVHGDIQLKNVMWVEEEPMLIDMDTLALGNPVFDFAGLYVTYQAFMEDDPGDAMSFLGIPAALVSKIWDAIVKTCLAFRDPKEEEEALRKIRLLAAVRFLYLLESSGLKTGELGRTRIRRTLGHIDELLPQVCTLTVDLPSFI